MNDFPRTCETTSTPKTFGEWVKRARNEKGWSQAKLAGRSFCALDTIRAIEQNRTNYRPSLDMAARLADCLEIPAAQRTEFIRLARGGKEDKAEIDIPHLDPELAATTSEIHAQTSNNENESLPKVTQPALTQSFVQKYFLWLTQLSTLSILVLILGPVTLFIALGVAIFFQQQWAAHASIEQTPGPLALANREPRIQVLANGRPIANGDTIPRYARVSVTFAVQNLGDQAIRVATLEAGARGPCAAQCTWASQGQPFSRARNLVLGPGEIFEYESSRVLVQPGNYFIEPVVQDIKGKYGGIQPFTRIEFTVSE